RGALAQVVIAVVGHPREPAAGGGAGELAGVDRQAVDQPPGVGVGEPVGQTVLNQVLDPPEGGGLAGEAGGADPGQRGELGGVVGLEVAEQVAVGIQAPELADDLDGDDLAVGELGPGAALAEPAEAEGFHLVVDEAEYREQELLRGHGGPPFDWVGGAPDHRRAVSPLPAPKSCTSRWLLTDAPPGRKKVAHRVS